MALTNSYLVTTKNLESFFNSLTTAQAPERFTQKFLENLELKSSNDRLYIGLLKALGFTDENGVPLDRYYNFLDQTRSKSVLAEGIHEAYGDLFAVNINAHEMSVQEVKNKLKTLTQGKKSDLVLGYMANTFHSLCEYAEWNSASEFGDQKPLSRDESSSPKVIVKEEGKDSDANAIRSTVPPHLHYNIQIHLPETRDQSVYDALFKSMQDHLL